LYQNPTKTETDDSGPTLICYCLKTNSECGACLNQRRKIRLKMESRVDSVFKRILVAVDGSEGSFRAARVAARLAKRNEADLLVVSVIQTPAHAFMPTRSMISPGVPVVGLQDYYKYASKDAQEWIDKVASIATALGVKVRKSILKGGTSVVRSLTDYASSQAVDLIVVGRKGSGGFSRLLLGSVSSGVVNHAASSVLVVR
jgi:nucleotide-binding universal stress UspA family protein